MSLARPSLKWDPVKLVVLITGHQLRCILCAHEAIFKGIGFYADYCFFALYIFCKEQTTYNQGYVSCCKFVKRINCQTCVYEWLHVCASKRAGLFISYVLEQRLHPNSSGKPQVLSTSRNVHKSVRLQSGYPIRQQFNSPYIEFKHDGKSGINSLSHDAKVNPTYFNPLWIRLLWCHPC